MSETELMRKTKSNKRTDGRATAAYIADLSRELTQLAEREHLGLLASLLKLASIEATRLSVATPLPS